MSQVYLISQASFAPYQDMSANIKPERLNTFIKKAQELDLRLLLGAPFYYDLLKNCNSDGSLKPDAPIEYAHLLAGCEYNNRQGQLIIYEGITPALVYFTLSRFVENDNIRYTTSGPVVKTREGSQAISYSDIIKLAQQYRSMANACANDIEKLLLSNKHDYPLWKFDDTNNTARQPGPRIRGIDKTSFNYPNGDVFYNLFNITDENDKKISQLAPYPLINGNEISVLSNGDTDYKFTISALLQYLTSNTNNRVTTLFGIALPQNNEGENGDVFINTADNTFAQKINGSWLIKYQHQTVANTSLFGLGVPVNSNGNNNDVYINTATGIFYKKANNAWIQVFSMQTGPAGPPGLKGDTGAAGAPGNTVLSGVSNPSNLSDGKNGDYYINTGTGLIFGPKTSGAWPNGRLLIQNLTPLNTININIAAGVTLSPFIYQYDGSAGDDPIPRVKLKNSDGSFTYDNNIAVTQSADGNTYTIAGQPDANGKFLFSYLFSLYPGGNVIDNIPIGVTISANNTFPLMLPYNLQS